MERRSFIKAPATAAAGSYVLPKFSEMMRLVQAVLLAIFAGSVVSAEEFPAALVRAAEQGEDRATIHRRFAETFPAEADWLTQCQPSPQVDGHGHSKALLSYLKGDKAFLIAGIERALAELGDAGRKWQPRFDALREQKPDGEGMEWAQLCVEVCGARRAQRLATLRSESPRILFIKRHERLHGNGFRCELCDSAIRRRDRDRQQTYLD
jgi:hypothetical protein